MNHKSMGRQNGLVNGIVARGSGRC